MSAIFTKLKDLQDKNSKVPLLAWKAKILPDEQGQRSLIAKNMSVRFMKTHVIAEIQEHRNEGGNSGLARPASAPGKESASPKEEEEEEGGETLMGRTRKPKAAKGHVDDGANEVAAQKLKASLSQRPSSAHAQRRQFLDVLTAPASAVEPRVLERNLQDQRALLKRDPTKVYQSLRTNIPGAKSFSLRSDQFGTKQDLDLKDILKKIDPIGTRKLGMALILDPSVVTEGYRVILRLKYLRDSKKTLPHTMSNVDAMNGNRQTLAAGNFAASQGLPAPFASTGRLHPSASTPTKESAAIAYSYNEEPFVPSANANNNDNPFDWGASWPHTALTSASPTRPSTANGTRKKKTSSSRLDADGSKRSQSSSVTVEYEINAARKYHFDLALTLSPKVRNTPVVNGMPMFLPGWEGCLPLFIPAGYALCRVLVTKETSSGNPDPDTEAEARRQADSPRSNPFARPTSAFNSRPSSASARLVSTRPSSAHTTRPPVHGGGASGVGGGVGAGVGGAWKGEGWDTSSGNIAGAGAGASATTLEVVKELNEAGSRPVHMLTLTGFAFPVESGSKALHMLNKLMQGEVLRQQQCTFTVPGGQPALHVAALHGNREACASLLDSGADVNIKNKASITALHEAVTGGSRDCVDVLLKYRADERTKDPDGNTPLHLACKVADMGCATALMRSKTAAVVLVTPNLQGKTPLDVCTTHTMRQAVERGMRSHFIAVPTQRNK